MDEDKFLAAALQHVGDPAVITDPTGSILYANPRFSEVTGWSASELLGRNPRLLQSGETPREVYSELWSTINAGKVWSGTIRNKRKDGSRYWADLTISPLMNADGTIVRFVGIEGGRTERRMAERRSLVRRAAAKSKLEGDGEEIARTALRDICEAMRWKFGAFWVPKGEVLRCAASWSMDRASVGEFEKVSRESAFERGVGLPGRVWLSGLPSWIEDVTRDGNFPRALAARTAGLGAAFAFPVMADDKFHGVLEFFNDCIEHPDDELLELMGDAGLQMALWLAKWDAERREKLGHSRRLAAVGQLAAGVAHELNNPLGVILGFAQSAKMEIGGAGPLAYPLSSIEREALRCRDIVTKLVNFSRRQSLSGLSVVDLDAVVRSALDVIEVRAQAQSADVIRDLAFSESIQGDPGELEQIVVILCNNSLDAMPAGGTLSICTRSVDRGGRRFARLEIRDSGSGIPADVQQRVFEPFFTTKGIGKGMGMGLSLVHGIVERHGGDIAFQSAPGKGTTVTVLFPIPRVQESASTAYPSNRS